MRGWTKRALAAPATLLLGVGLSVAQAAATEAARLPSAWMADRRTGCKVWDPQPEIGESVRWSGGCVGGYAAGRGVTEWIEHGQVTERIEGARQAGHAQGKGVQTLANGDRFEGSWKDDFKDGPGSYVSKQGWTYIGEFKKDRFDGHGVMTNRRGDRYEGGWKLGQRSGQGTYTGADGTHFTGLWVDNQPAGGPQSPS